MEISLLYAASSQLNKAAFTRLAEQVQERLHKSIYSTNHGISGKDFCFVLCFRIQSPRVEEVLQAAREREKVAQSCAVITVADAAARNVHANCGDNCSRGCGAADGGGCSQSVSVISSHQSRREGADPGEHHGKSHPQCRSRRASLQDGPAACARCLRLRLLLTVSDAVPLLSSRAFPLHNTSILSG